VNTRGRAASAGTRGEPLPSPPSPGHRPRHRASAAARRGGKQCRAGPPRLRHVLGTRRWRQGLGAMLGVGNPAPDSPAVTPRPGIAPLPVTQQGASAGTPTAETRSRHPALGGFSRRRCWGSPRRAQHDAQGLERCFPAGEFPGFTRWPPRSQLQTLHLARAELPQRSPHAVAGAGKEHPTRTASPCRCVSPRSRPRQAGSHSSAVLTLTKPSLHKLP